MFQPGDLVVYGRTGVCRVERIERERGQDFYALTPLYHSCNILTPVNGKIFMRPVISKEEALRLIDQMPSMEVEPWQSGALREMNERYQAIVATHECEDLIELVMSIYAKKKNAEQEKRKFGAADERFMKEGKALLHGELAVALDIPVDRVPGYISDRLAEAGAVPNI